MRRLALAAPARRPLARPTVAPGPPPDFALGTEPDVAGLERAGPPPADTAPARRETRPLGVRAALLALAAAAVLGAGLSPAGQAPRRAAAGLVHRLTAAVTLDAPAAAPDPARTPDPVPDEQLARTARSLAAASAATTGLDRTAELLLAGDDQGALDAFAAAVERLALVQPAQGRAALDARARLLRERLVAAVEQAPGASTPAS